MARLNNSGSDTQLNYYATGDRLYLCNSEPATYAEAVSFALAQKDNPVFSSVVDYDIGRELSIGATTNAVGIANGTALFFAVVNTVGSELLVVQNMESGLIVNIGGTISIDKIVFRIPNTPTGETFSEIDRPLIEDYNGLGDPCAMALPWNYDKEWNSTRKYPLVVIIGPSGTVGTDINIAITQLPPQFFTGSNPYSIGDEFSRHPSFVYVIQHDIYYDDSTALEDIANIDVLKSTYRIDENQLYVLGYSMGGSGTHYLSNNMFTEQGHKIASISRLVGYLEPTLSDSDIYPWYHVGLDDTPAWIEVVRDCYSNFKTANPGGIEKTDTRIVETYSSADKIYYLNGKQVARYSEYTGVGHGTIRDIVYSDPLALDWVMAKRVSNGI